MHCEYYYCSRVGVLLELSSPPRWELETMLSSLLLYQDGFPNLFIERERRKSFSPWDFLDHLTPLLEPLPPLSLFFLPWSLHLAWILRFYTGVGTCVVGCKRGLLPLLPTTATTKKYSAVHPREESAYVFRLIEGQSHLVGMTRKNVIIRKEEVSDCRRRKNRRRRWCFQFFYHTCAPLDDFDAVSV